MKKYYYRVITANGIKDFRDFDSAKDYYYNERHNGRNAQFICL